MEGSCIILIAPDWEIYIPVSGMFVYKYMYFFSAYFVTLPFLQIYRNTVLGKTSCEVQVTPEEQRVERYDKSEFQVR